MHIVARCNILQARCNILHQHLKFQVGPQMPGQLGMMPGGMGGLMLGGMPGLQLPGGLQGVPQLRHPFMGIAQQG